MARYIDAETLKNKILDDMAKAEREGKDLNGYTDSLFHLKTTQAADVVPKSEYDQLKKALEAQDAEYTQALQDKARECNMVIDKICLEHRAKLALLHSSHEQELAVAKREVAWKIFAELYNSVASKIQPHIRPICSDDLGFDAGFRNGKTDALLDVLVIIAELKKKHTEGE